MIIPHIKTETFNYNLPQDRIAKYPLPQRNHSKLLVYHNRIIEESTFHEIYRFIPSNYLLVFNDTKVLPARILFQKETGANIEVFLLEPFMPNDYAQIFNTHNTCQWLCMVGNAKKWRKNIILHKSLNINGEVLLIKANKISSQDNASVIEFTWNNHIPFSEILNAVGKIPIPPYLKRESEPIDLERYQTVFSKYLGSVAAPTASLHFTDEEFNHFIEKNIQTTYLTLHVGAGTFKPMTSQYIHEHSLHTELFQISQQTLKQIIHHYPNIVAVGTTVLRSLESIYHVGNYLLNNNGTLINEVSQWCEYDISIKNNPLYAMQSMLTYLEHHSLEKINIRTQLMISPGYQIKMANGLITNFHQPQSSLLALVAAFTGNDWKMLYDYALSHQFRFLSYGDSSLLWK